MCVKSEKQIEGKSAVFLHSPAPKNELMLINKSSVPQNKVTERIPLIPQKTPMYSYIVRKIKMLLLLKCEDLKKFK